MGRLMPTWFLWHYTMKNRCIVSIFMKLAYQVEKIVKRRELWVISRPRANSTHAGRRRTRIDSAWAAKAAKKSTGSPGRNLRSRATRTSVAENLPRTTCWFSWPLAEFDKALPAAAALTVRASSSWQLDLYSSSPLYVHVYFHFISVLDSGFKYAFHYTNSGTIAVTTRGRGGLGRTGPHRPEI